jgi:peptidyl-prolyl cis-trans isomerase D
MLKAFQKRTKLKNIVFGSILVLIALSMVLYLIPGFTGMGSDPTVSGVVAKVQGEEIQAFELQQAIFQFSRQNQIPVEMLEIYSTQVLNNLVLERALQREAERLGLQVSEEELVQQLRQSRDLFPDGKFVGRQAYEDMVYARFNVTLPEFERRTRNAILQEKLKGLVTDSVVVYPEEIRKRFAEMNEKVVLDYALIETAALGADIRPADDALMQYYQANQARYQIPEKRAGRAIVFSQAQIGQGISIPDADVQRYYQSNQNQFRVEERVHVSHILVDVDADATNKEALRGETERMLTRLKEGADFAAMARENSGDLGSASKGGDLGFIVRGQTVPEFENAAFSLEPGQLSELVETPFGFHIIKVSEHEQARMRSLEEASPEIQQILRQERVQAMMPRQAEEAATALRQAPNDLAAIAGRLKAQAVDFGPIASSDPFPQVGTAPELTQEIFILQKDEVGRAIPVSNGYVVPLVTELLPAHQGEFAEVKERVQSEYVEEQARERASAKATELAEALGRQEKKDLKRAAAALRVEVKTSEPLTRTTRIPSIGNPTELDRALFTKSAGEVAGPFPTPGGHVVFQIASKEAPNEALFSSQQTPIERQLLQQKKEQAFAVFEDNLRSRLEADGDLVIYYDVVSRLTAGTPGEHPPYPHSHPPGF